MSTSNRFYDTAAMPASIKRVSITIPESIKTSVVSSVQWGLCALIIAVFVGMYLYFGAAQH